MTISVLKQDPSTRKVKKNGYLIWIVDFHIKQAFFVFLFFVFVFKLIKCLGVTSVLIAIESP